MCELWCKDLDEKLAKANSIAMLHIPLEECNLPLQSQQSANRFICALSVYNRLQKEYISLSKTDQVSMRLLELGRALILQKQIIDELQ